MSMRSNQKEEIATIKPRTITIDLSDADCERISDQAARYGLTVGELLKNFIGDLVDGTYSNGSDERMYAEQYCQRCWYSWMNENLLSHLNTYSDVEEYLDLIDNIEDGKKDLAEYEKNPDKFDEEEIGFVKDDLEGWEQEKKEILEDWKPDYKVDMDEEIAICRKWLAEREAMKEGKANG